MSRAARRQGVHDAEPDEEPLAAGRAGAGLDHVAALSSRGRLLVFPLAEMREVPRGRGVIIMGLDGEEKLAAVGLATAEQGVLQGTNRLGRAVTVTIEGDELAKHRCIGRARARWSDRRSGSRDSGRRRDPRSPGANRCTLFAARRQSSRRERHSTNRS